MRKVPPALLAHLQSQVTTTCRLLRFTLADGRIYGLTTLDVAVVYLGVSYSAINGFDPSMIATESGLSVDNSEAYALLADEAAPGISLQMVRAGEMDNAQWELLLVNYMDLSMGHMVIDAGDVGNITVSNQVAYAPEMISYAMRLRQSIGTYDSRTCRATFGTPASSQTGCGVDAEALWQYGAVSGLGEETKRVFADSSLLITPQPIPGRVEWLTGDNLAVNRLYQVEAYSSVSGTIALLEPTPYDIKPGDTFRIRKDCAKTLAACQSYNNILNMKGEPYIPIGDGLETATPNAQIPGGVLGSEIVD